MPFSSTGNPNAFDPASDFATGLTGSCLCGSVQVTIHDTQLFTQRRGHLCHCENCRKASGSVVASNFLIEESKVDVKDTKGTLKIYEDYNTLSGNPVLRNFCGDCGSPIISQTRNQGAEGKIILKMGIFPRIPTPEMEAFALYRHPWESFVDGAVQFKLLRGGEVLPEAGDQGST